MPRLLFTALPPHNWLLIAIRQLNKQWVRDYLPDLDRGEVDLSLVRADGDADLADADFAGFVVPGCVNCSSGSCTASSSTTTTTSGSDRHDGTAAGAGNAASAGGHGAGGGRHHRHQPQGASGGVVKPDVVFFGGNIDKAVRDAAREAVERSSGLLLLGTSAQVQSAYRLCRLAVEELKIPLAIVNIGETRADHMASLKFEGAYVGDGGVEKAIFIVVVFFVVVSVSPSR
jgi:hypothetical protein